MPSKTMLSDMVAQWVKNLPAMQKTPVQFLSRDDPWKRDRLPTLVFLGFPGGSDSKESTCNAGVLGSIPGLGRSPGGGHGNPHSILAWRSPWTEEPGGLQSMGPQRARHDLVTKQQQRCPPSLLFSLHSWIKAQRGDQLACGYSTIRRVLEPKHS